MLIMRYLIENIRALDSLYGINVIYRLLEEWSNKKTRIESTKLKLGEFYYCTQNE